MTGVGFSLLERGQTKSSLRIGASRGSNGNGGWCGESVDKRSNGRDWVLLCVAEGLTSGFSMKQRSVCVPSWNTKRRVAGIFGEPIVAYLPTYLSGTGCTELECALELPLSWWTDSVGAPCRTCGRSPAFSPRPLEFLEAGR